MPVRQRSLLRRWSLVGVGSCALYLVAAFVWIYAVYDRYPGPAGAWFVVSLASLAAAYVLGGLALGGVAFALPLLTIALALPAGPRDGDDDKLWVAFAAAYLWFLPALVLVALGVALRRLRLGKSVLRP